MGLRARVRVRVTVTVRASEGWRVLLIQLLALELVAQCEPSRVAAEEREHLAVGGLGWGSGSGSGLGLGLG